MSKTKKETDVQVAGEADAALARTAALLGSKWMLLVLRDLAAGRNRFTLLERSLVGISPKTLSQRLKTLEDLGVISRRAYPEVPPRVEYTLTAKGRDLIPLLEYLREYGERWLCT